MTNRAPITNKFISEITDMDYTFSAIDTIDRSVLFHYDKLDLVSKYITQPYATLLLDNKQWFLALVERLKFNSKIKCNFTYDVDIDYRVLLSKYKFLFMELRPQTMRDYLVVFATLFFGYNSFTDYLLEVLKQCNNTVEECMCIFDATDSIELASAVMSVPINNYDEFYKQIPHSVMNMLDNGVDISIIDIIIKKIEPIIHNIQPAILDYVVDLCVRRGNVPHLRYIVDYIGIQVKFVMANETFVPGSVEMEEYLKDNGVCWY